MKEQRTYLYAAGVATGIIMAILSVLVSFRMLTYLAGGGSWLALIIISLVIGIVIGGLIAFVINFISRD